MERGEFSRAIYGASHIVGDFLLRSGSRSTEYFDKYRFESDPVLLGHIAESLISLVPPDTEVLAGLEMGGIPIVTALSMATGLPAAYVRKKAKEYGTCRLAEGADVADRRVLVIEDVVTSGGQVVLSVKDLQAVGAKVEHALCVIDRQAGGAEALASINVSLKSLFTMDELKRAVQV